MKTLQLRKMGMDFYDDRQKAISDCGNYRLRAEFTEQQGYKVIADFTTDSCNRLYADASFEDTRDGYCYRYKPLEDAGRKLGAYCLTNILKAVNSVSAEQYDDIQVVE